MKRIFTSISILLFLTSQVFAGPIDPTKALEIANSFWNSNTGLNKDTRLKFVSTNEVAKAPSRDGAQKSDPAFYLFNSCDNKGFIIVSGDDQLKPVVGYSDKASIDEMPTALIEWLNEYSSYVDDVRAGIAVPASQNTNTKGTAITPMLKTSWNQSAPYNNMCPEVNGQKTPTGCTATAMAQIMKFHEWPKKPSKNFTWYNNITGKDEYVNTSSHTYSWDKMLPHYRNGYTQEEADAVALLMIDVGKAISSNYALAGTGSSDIYASYALVNIFNYTPEIQVVKRSEYTEEEYISIIRENLEARQPLLYTGHSQSYSSGHAFVCDGIDENNLLHIDWGWDGSYNGYFDMTYMSPSGTGIGGGDGRYNVGQTFVANIRPRQDGEPNVAGTPSVYMMDVVDAKATGTPPTLIKQTIDYNTNKTANIKFAAGLLNWSHSSINLSMYIGIEKDGELISVTKIGEEKKTPFNDSFGYYITFTINNNPQSEDYIEKGTYRLRVCYSDDSGENIYIARGSENGLILEVNDTSVTLSKELPEIEVTDIRFHVTPQMKGDRIAFDADFKTNNGKSSTVLIVPVINKIQDNNTYTSTVLYDNAALIQVYDDRNIMATFSTSYMLPENGKYFISFKYNIKNEFFEKSLEVDKANLLEIAGKSNDIDIKPLPDGLVLSTTELSAKAITWGEKAEVTATVKNISNSNYSFTGGLAIVLEDKNTGSRYVVAKEDYENIEKGNSIEIKFTNSDYFPVIKPGNYNVMVCQFNEKNWTPIRQSAATCTMTISSTSAVIPYVSDVIVINEGNDVLQGSKFKANVRLSCVNGDFDGYVRVNITSGLSYNVRSEYVAVSLKKGETTNITFNCSTKSTIALNKYRLAMTYNDADKNKLGDISNNTLSFVGNGYFWVCDATAINDVDENNTNITTNGKNITINGFTTGTEVVIYSVDGKEVYRGTDKSVAVKRGMYIVSVETEGEKPYTTKIFVK